METTIRAMKPGQKGTVVRLLAEGPLKRRLFDMGITPGAQVFMRKVAPLGDPIEINIRGYELSIRKTEAETVLIRISEEVNK